MFEKKRGKRFLASVMALVMLLSLAPVGALATEDQGQPAENQPVAQPADETNPKPTVTGGEDTTNTNEEPTPPPSNEGDAGTPADNNDTSTAVSETLMILNPVDLLNQASDYTTELTWSSNTQDATFFYLKTPTSNPYSNTAGDWGETMGDGDGKINISNLNWTRTNAPGQGHRVENAFNVTNDMVTSWPSGSGSYNNEKGGYVLNKTSTHWKAIFKAYKESIKKQLKMEDVQEEDVQDIILKPFKVSRYNITNGSYHVDCQVEVKGYKFATATFNLWDDEKGAYKFYSAKDYKVGSPVEFPSEMNKTGYTFRGWYLDEELTQPAPDSYTINNNVNFYAKYEKKQPPAPKTYTLTIKYVYEDGSEAATTHTEQLKKDAEYNVSSPEVTGYVADKATVSGTMPAKDTEVTVTYIKKEPVVSQLTYSIKLHLIDGSGEDSTTNIVENQTADAGKKLNNLITADVTDKVNELKGDKKYVPGETKINEKTPLTDDATLTANDTTIHLYYYLDEVGETGKDEENKPTDKPDGTPDAWQYKVTFKVVNGSWNNKTNEAIVKYVTKKDAAGNNSATGTAKLDTVPAVGSEPNSGYKASGNWDETPSVGLEIKKDTVFTFTYSRRSSSGGSSRPSTPPTVDIPDNDVPTGLNGKDHYAYIIGYGNNDVRPQNNITRAEVATIFFRLLTDETRTANMTKSNSYNDVKDGDWFCCAVSTLSKMGIIKGYEDGSFKPNAPISRAEFAAIAARFDPDGDKTPATFADVTSHWAKDEISIAANHGWIKGYEDGSFKPDQKITRAETMTLVNRVLNRLPETKDDLHKDMKTWVDNMDETAWYYLAVQEATNSHYFKNKTSTKFEQWTELRDTRDWSELEK